jgi:hypothetical protein
MFYECQHGTDATTGRCKPGVTTAWSPMLAIDDAIKGRPGDVAHRRPMSNWDR